MGGEEREGVGEEIEEKKNTPEGAGEKQNKNKRKKTRDSLAVKGWRVFFFAQKVLHLLPWE